MSWCRVPDFSATSCTKGVSGASRSASGTKFSVSPTKSTAKLRTFSPWPASCAAAIAVIAEESRPPESRVQLGTSATIWRRTMSSSSSRTRATVVSRSSVCSLVSRVQ